MRIATRILALAVTFGVAACDSPQNFMSSTGGPAARELASLGWQALVAFGAATLATWILIVWLAFRRRGTLAEHAPVDANRGQGWILIGGFAIPLAVLAALFISMIDSMASSPIQHTDGAGAHGSPETRAMGHGPDIRVAGQRWWFEAEYHPGAGSHQVFVPNEIHVPVGRPVDIELETRDVIHSFWIPKLHGKVDLVPGLTNRIRILATRPGRYSGQCAEYCGLEHARMRLVVVAQEESDYQAWLAGQREPALAPDSELAAQGRDVFMSTACPICHTVRGTEARGRVGPDLTHFASRKTFAGGAFENNTANLQAWITNAQSLKPGSQMPNLTQFSGADLRAITTYLQGLR
jgi:cytochrome c oxidase subunit 2